MGQTFDKNELKETPKNTSHTKNRANSKFASITIKDKKFDTLGADFKQSFNPQKFRSELTTPQDQQDYFYNGEAMM